MISIDFNTATNTLTINGGSRPWNKAFVPTQFRAVFPTADIRINGVLIYMA